MKMIDKKEVAYRFHKSVETYEENAPVQKHIAEHFAELFSYCTIKNNSKILEIGCGTGLLTGVVRNIRPDSIYYINDLVGDMCKKTANSYKIPASNCLTGDIENLSLPAEFDIIVSASTFQWFENPANTLNHLSDVLTKDGFLIFNSFGRNNLLELRTVTGKGLIYRSMDEWKKLLNTHFEVLYSEEETCQMYFNDPADVLKHTKRTGVNALNDKTKVWTKSMHENFKKEYHNHFFSEGRYPLTYHPVYFVCKKK